MARRPPPLVLAAQHRAEGKADRVLSGLVQRLLFADHERLDVAGAVCVPPTDAAVARRLGLRNPGEPHVRPPQPGASTNALSAVESSSTSDPSTAAQNLASASASAASNDADLITLGMPAS